MELTYSIPVLTEDFFFEKRENISESEAISFDTYFTDEQAKDICSKMSNKKVRFFSQLFGNIDIVTDQNQLRYQMHYLANEALRLYGSKIISFIHSLKKWPRRATGTYVLTSFIRSSYNYTPHFSKLELYSNEGRQYTIRFKKAYERPVDNLPMLFVTNQQNGRTSKISKNGLLIDDLYNCIPEIGLFLTEDNGEVRLYAGYDDDVCDICGRPLWDYISVKYGRGPICRRDYGVP